MRFLERLVLSLERQPSFPELTSRTNAISGDVQLDLGIVIPYFNGLNSPVRRKNFLVTWKKLLTQVPPHCVRVVEQLLPGQISEISNHLPKDTWHPVVGGDFLWQKECLINIGARNLISIGAKNIAWLDADVLFTNDNWFDEAIFLLRDKSLIQLFKVSRRDKKTLRKGVAYQFTLSPWIRTVGLSSGYGWAANADLFKGGRGGLYENAVLGGADALLWLAFCGENWSLRKRLELGWISALRQLPRKMKIDYRRWAEAFFGKITKGVGYLDQGVVSLPHGNIERREYGSRYRRIPDFDPETDLVRDSNGLLQFRGSQADTLRKKVKDYFLSRQEG